MLTGKDLLLAIRDYIVEVPSRLDMEHFYGGGCGTNCCIAGHGFGINGLDLRREAEFICNDLFRSITLSHLISCTTQEMFRLSKKEAILLFWFHCGWVRDILHDAEDVYEDVYEDLRKRLLVLSAGTPEYAWVVAEAIDRCIDRNFLHDIEEPVSVSVSEERELVLA